MKKLLYIFFTLLLALSAFSTHAQDSYTLLEPLPCIDGVNEGVKCTTKDGVSVQTEIDFNTYLSYIFKFGIAIAGFLAVVMIIVGGFEYMLSEAPFAKTNGKDRMTNAIIGLLGVLTSYLILVTIDPRLVQINSALPRIEIPIDEALRFRNQLATDLDAVNESTRLDYASTTSKIREKEKQIAALETKKGGPGLTAEEELLLAKLKDETNGLLGQRTKSVANENLDNRFSRTLIKINDLSYTSSAGAMKEIEAELLGLKTTAEKYAAEAGLAGDLEEQRKLQYKGAFFEAQLKEQTDFISALSNYTDSGYSSVTPGTSGIIYRAYDYASKYAAKMALQSYLAKYKSELGSLYDSLESTYQVRESDTLATQYEALLKSRVGLIENALK